MALPHGAGGRRGGGGVLAVHRARIQRVDTARGPVQRLFGLADVTVTTASSASAIKIEALDHELAADLAERLTARTQATPGDAT
jgi:membrane protein YdbS with pleckstrin-like domain